MGLRDIGAALPPGFRFYPTDEELVCHYLYKKIANEEVLKGTLVEIDLHTCEPWQLPEVAKLNSNEWYFFSFRDRKYATGYRTNRATTSGYWKATGKDRTVVDPRTNGIVGMRKTLVFYKHRAPNGVKTGWIMHEFRLETPHLPPKEDWVLCRVFHKTKTTENNHQLSPQDVFEAEATAADTSLVPHQILPLGYLHQSPAPSQHQNPNPNNPLELSTLNPNFLQLSQIMMINSKCEEDKYGYLFDMNFEESNLGSDGIMASNMEEMGFEDDDHSLVFL